MVVFIISNRAQKRNEISTYILYSRIGKKVILMIIYQNNEIKKYTNVLPPGFQNVLSLCQPCH